MPFGSVSWFWNLCKFSIMLSASLINNNAGAIMGIRLVKMMRNVVIVFKLNLNLFVGKVIRRPGFKSLDYFGKLFHLKIFFITRMGLE